jgi:hypothetical protein|tara:strand:- start:290 stop:583 length:294 start_codon:yes stop_codon:yes gene_type:complete
MTEESKLYHIEKIVTYRYRCIKCGVYGSEESYYDDEPCSTCSGGKANGKQTYFKIPEKEQECKLSRRYGNCKQIQYIKLRPSQHDEYRKKGYEIEIC